MLSHPPVPPRRLARLRRLAHHARRLVQGAALLAALPAAALPAAASAHPLLLISIDGLRPGEVLEAPARGLALPHLRAFLAQGAYAQGVTGVLPTITYPSHTTLITGKAPAAHNIVANTTFDPLQINAEGWYWYASDITAPTLWQAAHEAQLTTGNVHWPVSVGAAGIDWNLPQIWHTGHADDEKLLGALATPGLLPALQASEGAYARGIDESLAGDETRARFAVRLIGLHRPDFLTVYLTALDHTQHLEGPGSAPAHATLERLDALVGELVAAERAAHPDADIALVSDHGFAPVTQALNLGRAFLDAGLLTGENKGPGRGYALTGWQAAPWPCGGSFAVVLARPQDAALQARVADLLARLAANPANGIKRIITAPAIHAGGGNPEASFFVELAAGTMAMPWRGPDLPLMVAPAPYKGMHGYFPDDPRMRATFLVMGPGVAAGRDLGVIDMRAIAPTLAGLMGARLTGEVAPLALAP